ncbi:MAG: 6-bladed beta-propeller [Balneolales bacterium]
MKIRCIIFSLILFMGCSKQETIEIPEHMKHLDNLTVYNTDVEPAMTINLEREISFGETEDVIIGRMGDISISESGRVFISDMSQNTIHVFDPEGSYVTKIGNRGRGPGEFNHITAMKIDSNRLYTYDSNLNRINIFSLESLDLYRTVSLNPENWNHIEELSRMYTRPKDFHIRNDSTMLISFTHGFTENEYYVPYLMNIEGEIISDKVFEHKGYTYFSTARSAGYMQYAYFSFMPVSLITVSDGDRIYLAWSEDFLVKIYDPKGGYERAFYYPHKNVKLDQEKEFEDYNDVLMRMIQGEELPENWPAMNSMQFDDVNRLWISTIVEDSSVYDWWVLDDQGNLLAKFTWPRDKGSDWPGDQAIEEVKNGYLYARETEEDTGLVEIVRYRIEMEDI